MSEENNEIYTKEDMKKQVYDEIITDVKKEIDAREENIKIYYPYFVINKKLQIESENLGIDLNSIFIGLLSFLLYIGKLNNKKIEYQDIYDYVEYFIKIIYGNNLPNLKKVVNTLLDIAQNGGNNFVFTYYSLDSKEYKERHIKYIEIKLGENGKLNYYITPQGIDFYLKTKEFPESTQITINLLLFRKQIEKGAFEYAYDTVRRLNIEVKRKIEQKDVVLEALTYGGKDGIKEYIKYNELVQDQFKEEEELFEEILVLVKNIYNEYLEGTSNLGEKENKTIGLIKNIENELSKAVSSHTKLLNEAINMTKKYDEIIRIKAKSAFSEKFKFESEFEKLIEKTNDPEKLLYFISPFLLPKSIKSFNPMKSLEEQKLYTVNEEEEVKENNKVQSLETIDDITQKRVTKNFEFYINSLMTLLRAKSNVTLSELTDYIKESYGENAIYNVDFVSFVIFLNSKKKIVKEFSDIFSDVEFKSILIIPQKEDIDLGNGLKITDIVFERGDE